MLKRGLILLVFLLFIQISLAQESSCTIAYRDSVAPVAQRILQTYSQIYKDEKKAVEVAIDSVNRWEPPENVDQNWVNFKTEVQDEIRMLGGIESFSGIKARAKRELKCNGITSEQREAYTSGISESLYSGILPLNYYPWDKLKEFIPNIIWRDRELANIGREDAWRFYLGLPQISNTFAISNYKPSISREDKYYYSINDFESKTVFSIEGFLQYFNDGKTSVISQDFLIDANVGIGGSFIMGFYKVSKGRDEKGHYLSYYDIWNLEGVDDESLHMYKELFIEGEEGFFGKPFEIYDRIYYDPETFEILPEEPEEEIFCQ